MKYTRSFSRANSQERRAQASRRLERPRPGRENPDTNSAHNFRTHGSGFSGMELPISQVQSGPRRPWVTAGQNGNKLLLCKVLHAQFPLAGSPRREYALKSAPLRLRRIYEKPRPCHCLRFPYFDVCVGLRRRFGHKPTSSGGIDTLQRRSQRCNDRTRILRAWIIAAGRHGSDDSRQRTLGGGVRC